jgi:thiamine-monophosphate kinase
MRLRDAGELEFIRLLRAEAGAADGSVLVGIGDDAAVLACSETESLLLKCDAAVAGQHFRREWFTPAEIGARATLGAISDIAAMGGRPVAILLTLLISPDEELATAREIVRGAAEAGAGFGAPLAGGETVGTSGPLALDVIVAGFAPQGRELRRSAARPGEALLVSGTLGDSAAGLACLERGVTGDAAARYAISRHKRPQPRVALGQLLVEFGVRAAIDLSDGLLRDARHLATESGAALVIEKEALPLSPEAREVASRLRQDALVWATGGGEDFELLFTAEPSAAPSLIAAASERLGLPVTRIGTVEAGAGVRVVAADGAEWPPAAEGWDQFRRA